MTVTIIAGKNAPFEMYSFAKHFSIVSRGGGLVIDSNIHCSKTKEIIYL